MPLSSNCGIIADCVLRCDQNIQDMWLWHEKNIWFDNNMHEYRPVLILIFYVCVRGNNKSMGAPAVCLCARQFILSVVWMGVDGACQIFRPDGEAERRGILWRSNKGWKRQQHKGRDSEEETHSRSCCQRESAEGSPGWRRTCPPQQDEGKGLWTGFVPACVSAVLDGMKDSWRWKGGPVVWVGRSDGDAGGAGKSWKELRWCTGTDRYTARWVYDRCQVSCSLMYPVTCCRCSGLVSPTFTLMMCPLFWWRRNVLKVLCVVLTTGGATGHCY